MSNQLANEIRSSRPRAAWVVGSAAVLVALTLLAPMASAHTYRAPYLKFKETSFGWLRQVSGCATARSSTPTFSGSTGVGLWGGRASASSCNGSLGSVVSSNLGEAAGAAQVAVAIHVPSGTARSTTIAVTWNFSASGAAKLTITRPCPTPVLVNGTGTSVCVAQAVAMVIGNAWLVDLTNGSVASSYNFPISLGQYNTSENTTTCNPNCTSGTYAYAGGAAFSGPQTATFDISAITDSAHRYTLVTYLGGTVFTEIQGFGGHANGFVNLNTGGNHYQLVSIIIT